MKIWRNKKWTWKEGQWLCKTFKTRGFCTNFWRRKAIVPESVHRYSFESVPSCRSSENSPLTCRSIDFSAAYVTGLKLGSVAAESQPFRRFFGVLTEFMNHGERAPFFERDDHGIFISFSRCELTREMKVLELFLYLLPYVSSYGLYENLLCLPVQKRCDDRTSSFAASAPPTNRISYTKSAILYVIWSARKCLGVKLVNPYSVEHVVDR